MRDRITISKLRKLVSNVSKLTGWEITIERHTYIGTKICLNRGSTNMFSTGLTTVRECYDLLLAFRIGWEAANGMGIATLVRDKTGQPPTGKNIILIPHRAYKIKTHVGEVLRKSYQVYVGTNLYREYHENTAKTNWLKGEDLLKSIRDEMKHLQHLFGGVIVDRTTELQQNFIADAEL